MELKLTTRLSQSKLLNSQFGFKNERSSCIIVQTYIWRKYIKYIIKLEGSVDIFRIIPVLNSTNYTNSEYLGKKGLERTNVKEFAVQYASGNAACKKYRVLCRAFQTRQRCRKLSFPAMISYSMKHLANTRLVDLLIHHSWSALGVKAYRKVTASVIFGLLELPYTASTTTFIRHSLIHIELQILLW